MYKQHLPELWKNASNGQRLKALLGSGLIIIPAWGVGFPLLAFLGGAIIVLAGPIVYFGLLGMHIQLPAELVAESLARDGVHYHNNYSVSGSDVMDNP